jgi:hypothetical protein
MAFRLVTRGPSITTAAAAKKLAPLHRDQLLAALASTFGKKTSFAAAFPADEPAEAQRYEVTVQGDPAPRYDLWEISVDAGVLFAHGTTDRTGIELGQGGFALASDATDPELGDLVAALTAAERVPDPDAPLILEKDTSGRKTVFRVAGFSRADAVPTNKKEWDKLLGWPNIYVTEGFAKTYAASFTPGNWTTIARYARLSEGFILEHAEKLGWSEISRCQVLSEAFLTEHADRVDWAGASHEQRLSEGFLRTHADRVDWSAVARSQALSDAFIEELADRLPFRQLNATRLSESFIRKHADALDWSGPLGVSEHPCLSLAFLQEHADRLVWSRVTLRRGHEEALVEAFGDRIEWRLLGANVSVSEAQLRRYADRVDWRTVVRSGRPLSDELVRDHAAFLDETSWRQLVETRRVSPAYAKEISAQLKAAKKAKG